MNKFAARLARPLMIGLGLFALSLVLRIACFVLFPHPAYPDSFYYSAVAQSLASGHGFSINYIWNFIEVGSTVPAHGVLPIASNAHWMPLASLIQVPFMLVFGINDVAGAIPFILLGALLAPLSYAFARDMLPDELRVNEIPAILVGLFAASTGYAIEFLSQPDNFALYAVLVVLTLWIVGRLVRGDAGVKLGRHSFGTTASMIIAGSLSGLAFLSRNDGVLLPVAIGLVWLIGALGARRHHTRAAFSFRALLIYGVVALVVVAPWLIRQELVFGSLSPSSSTGRILWIRTYQELFSADGPIGPSYLFSWGWQNLLLSRLQAVVSVILLSSIDLLFIGGILWVLPALRHNLLRPGLRPYLVWTAVFFAWSILVAAPHLPTGNYLHSAVALVPLLFLLLVDGLYRFAREVADFPLFRRFSVGRIERRVIFGTLCVMVIFSAAFSFSTASLWANYRSGYEPALAAIRDHGGAGQMVMAADPGLVWELDHATPAIQTPGSDLAVVEQAAQSYGVHWLILDRDSVVASLVPVMKGTVHPAWLSITPIYQSPLNDPMAKGSNAQYHRITVYEVVIPPPVGS